ncbi:hypothetical protein J007_00388 [Cryptococcus neoformans]|nr:hypothetical protein C356_00393 [Cryptococcus neoformans var. grubii c45]OXB39815.1 hypothetical protein J007_00388 [Cryptococcus neoformans var. grubii]OXC66014.1 hypothetical protein C358_00380 [Cryptococcus neoformans var. grubii MW-RSA852]
MMFSYGKICGMTERDGSLSAARVAAHSDILLATVSH